MGRLICLNGKTKGQVLELHSRNIFGRNADCSFVLKDSRVSSRHCKIEKVSPFDFQIVDLDSSNGTFVNNERVTSHTLTPGDVLMIGPMQFCFHPRQGGGQNSSTVIMELEEFQNTSKRLLHCNKPIMKDWLFCPWCGEELE